MQNELSGDSHASDAGALAADLAGVRTRAVSLRTLAEKCAGAIETHLYQRRRRAKDVAALEQVVQQLEAFCEEAPARLGPSVPEEALSHDAVEKELTSAQVSTSIF